MWKSFRKLGNDLLTGMTIRVWARELDLSLLLLWLLMNLMAGHILEWDCSFSKNEKGIVEDQCGTPEDSLWFIQLLLKQVGILSMQDVAKISTYSWDNRGKNNKHINNYRSLHLHRTFHFKTLRDLSKVRRGVCLFLFCFFCCCCCFFL